MTPGRGRPHHWPCRHCDMVGDYHLERDAQLRRSETLDRRDEIDRLIVFRDWLRSCEWESHRLDDATDIVEDDEWDAAWAAHALTVPSPRDPVEQARAAVDAIPPAELLDDEPPPITATDDNDELTEDLSRWEIAS